MNKLTMVFLITLLFSSEAEYAQKISIGFTDGIYKSSVHCKIASHMVVYNIGWLRNTGIFLNYSVNKNLSLQTEFSKKGNGIIIGNSRGIDGGGWSGRYEMTYFTVPVLANIEFGKSIKFHCYAGLYFDFLNSAKNKITIYTDNSIPYQIDRSYDPANEFRKFGTGSIFGLGVKIPLCNQVWIFVDSRYSTSFTKSVKDNIEYKDYHLIRFIQDAYFHSFSVNWGILYRFTRK